jgi:hypothetical protein
MMFLKLYVKRQRREVQFVNKGAAHRSMNYHISKQESPTAALIPSLGFSFQLIESRMLWITLNDTLNLVAIDRLALFKCINS